MSRPKSALPVLAVAGLLSIGLAPSAIAATSWTPAPPYPEVAAETPSAAAADARGNQTLLTAGTFNGQHAVFTATLAAGGRAWSAPQVLEILPNKASGLKLSVAANGRAIAGWNHLDSDGFTGRVATRGAEGQWSAPTSFKTTYPEVAIAPSGEAWVSYLETIGTPSSTPIPLPTKAHLTRRPAGSSAWVEETPFSTYKPVVPEFDAAGDAFAVLTQGRDLVATRRIAGTTSWEPLEHLSTPDSPDGFVQAWPWDADVNDDGDIAVAWVEAHSGYSLLKVAQRPIGGRWGAPTTFAEAPNTIDGPFPGVAVGQDRDGHATFAAQHTLPDGPDGQSTEILVGIQDSLGHWPAALSPLSLPEGQQPWKLIYDQLSVTEGPAGHAVAQWRTPDGLGVAVRPRGGAFAFSAPPATAQIGEVVDVTDAGVATLGSGSRILIGDEGTTTPVARVSVRISGVRACPTKPSVLTPSGVATLTVSKLSSSPVTCLIEGNARAPRGAKVGSRVPALLTGYGITPRVVSLPVVLPAQ